MARFGLLTHRKFFRLVRLIGAHCQPCPKALAAGLLELLWDGAYISADEWVGAADDVDLRVDWRGPAGLLAPALADAGFLDLDPETERYRIHDFWHHAPHHVKQRAEREANRRALGKTLSDLRSEAGKKGREQRSKNEQRKRLSAGSQVSTEATDTQQQKDSNFAQPPSGDPTDLPGNEAVWAVFAHWRELYQEHAQADLRGSRPRLIKQAIASRRRVLGCDRRTAVELVKAAIDQAPRDPYLNGERDGEAKTELAAILETATFERLCRAANGDGVAGSGESDLYRFDK